MVLFGSKRIRDLENLIAHLKNDKQGLRNGADKSLRSAIGAESTATIDFMCRNKELAIHPYMFVNSKGKILGYTSAITTALNLKRSVVGENYLDIFYPQGNEKTRTELRKYFSSPKEIEVPYEIKKGKKTIELTIIKEAPVYTGEIELTSIKNTRKFHTVAYVPIKVEPRKSSLRKLIRLSLKGKKEIEVQVHEARVNLFLNHGMSFNDSEDYMVKHGTEGLVKEYKRLKKEAK